MPSRKLAFRRVGLLPDREENRLNGRARFYTAPIENSSAGYETLPYKKNRHDRGALSKVGI